MPGQCLRRRWGPTGGGRCGGPGGRRGTSVRPAGAPCQLWLRPRLRTPGQAPCEQRGSSPVPGAGRARRRGGARPSRSGSARRCPARASVVGAACAARELSLVLTTRPRGAEAAGPPRACGGGGRAPPASSVLPASLALSSTAEIWSRAEAAAAEPQGDPGPAPHPESSQWAIAEPVGWSEREIQWRPGAWHTRRAHQVLASVMAPPTLG